MGRKWPADNSARLRITYRELQLDVGTDGVESNLPLQVGGTNENLVVDLIEDGRSQSHSDFQAAIYRILHLAAQRQRTEEELRSAREQAEVASKAKSAFLAHVSHEIRTPMNAILGFAQLLHRDSELTSDQRTRVERILRAGDHLTSLINSVLEISKIESGHVRMSYADKAAPHFKGLARKLPARAVYDNLRIGVVRIVAKGQPTGWVGVLHAIAMAGSRRG